MATLSFRNVSKVYPNKVQAVFNFDMEVKDKEFIVLVGPSGCGKSTTLRMLAGYEDISEGEIYIDDILVNDMAPKDRNIAMVFQNYALYPHMTVYDNIAFALKLRKVSKPVFKIDDKNPEYLKEQNEIIAKNKQEHIDGLTRLKQEKATREMIKEFKFAKNNELRVALTKLDEKYSKPVLTYDLKKAKDLEEAINKEVDKVKINSLRAKLAKVYNTLDQQTYITRHYTTDEIAEKVTETAEILGLTPYLRRKPAALSGGQRQRVALGRAIVRKPKVFLMDEPLSNLDAKLRVQTRSEISKIHKRVGATTIYVTHDQTEAMTMADRIVVMKNGHIQQIGTPKEVYSKPANIFVAGFVGSPSMNFFNGVFNGKEFVFKTSKVKFTLSNEQINRLKLYKGKSVIMGIRPEDFYFGSDKSIDYPSKAIIGKVELCELLGHEVIVHTKIGGQKVVVKTAAKHEINSGDTCSFVYDINKVHFFDLVTTNRIDSKNKVIKKVK